MHYNCLIVVLILLVCVFSVGEQSCCPGSPVGEGLTREAAEELGLNPGTAVGASLIDAHAGGLGESPIRG